MSGEKVDLVGNYQISVNLKIGRVGLLSFFKITLIFCQYLDCAVLYLWETCLLLSEFIKPDRIVFSQVIASNSFFWAFAINIM